jgi:hypothetical protein
MALWHLQKATQKTQSPNRRKLAESGHPVKESKQEEEKRV